ncbi:MAG TPA: glycosyltransferase family 1 protein [Bryobacteraceae bacterium]|nr:glycosyltransferase family 1 protein [Bryobacteraceae bacterium]
MRIALDATYGVGSELTGVGVYCREILHGLVRRHPEAAYRFCYRPHKYGKALREPVPRGAARWPFTDSWLPPHDLFHGLNQRVPAARTRRCVTTFHDLFVMTGDYSTPDFRERFTAQARQAASRSDLVLCVSAFTASQVQSLLHVPPARLRVIHHGVHAPAKLPPGEEREPIVLSVGSIQKRKNTARLVEAFAQTRPGWRLILAGAAGYGAEGIVERLRKGPRADDIEITGYVSNAELESLYRRASLFAFPSLDEGFGIPLIEAMAWGVPVVTSDRSALAEVAGEAALNVNPEDVGELAQALQTLMDQPSLRRELAQRGRERASHFTWERAVDATWQAYQELL